MRGVIVKQPNLGLLYPRIGLVLLAKLRPPDLDKLSQHRLVTVTG